MSVENNDIIKKVRFARKPETLEIMQKESGVGDVPHSLDIKVELVCVLSAKEFEQFKKQPLRTDYPFITQNKQYMYSENGVEHCILIKAVKSSDGILVQSERGEYARFAAYVPKCDLLVDVYDAPADRTSQAEREIHQTTVTLPFRDMQEYYNPKKAVFHDKVSDISLVIYLRDAKTFEWYRENVETACMKLDDLVGRYSDYNEQNGTVSCVLITSEDNKSGFLSVCTATTFVEDISNLPFDLDKVPVYSAFNIGPPKKEKGVQER